MREERYAAGCCVKCGLARESARQLCDKCKEKNSETHKRWWAKAGMTHRRYNLKRAYGLTEQQWNAMFASQGMVCAICGSAKSGSKGWQTDHDHATVRVRSILCHLCNVGLGAFRDDTGVMARAIEYIRKHRLTLVG